MAPLGASLADSDRRTVYRPHPDRDREDRTERRVARRRHHGVEVVGHDRDHRSAGHRRRTCREGISQSLQLIAAATDEFASTIQEVARHASEASSVASAATDEVNAANATVADLAVARTTSKKSCGSSETSPPRPTPLSLERHDRGSARRRGGPWVLAVVAGEVKQLSQQTGGDGNVGASVSSIQEGSGAGRGRDGSGHRHHGQGQRQPAWNRIRR